MNAQAALFQILFQNEMLFDLQENKRTTVEKSEVPAIKSASLPTTPPTPVPETKVKQADIPKAPAELAVQPLPALKHKILILTEEERQKEMQAGEALFLDNILKAVKFSIQEADIFNISFLPPTNARDVVTNKKIKYFITFNVPLIKLHIDQFLVPYTPKLVDGIWYLLADPLTTIEADRELKKKLWQALQKMFEGNSQ